MDIMDKDPLPPDPIAGIEESLEEGIRLLREAGESYFLPQLEKIRARFKEAEPAYDICVDLEAICAPEGKNFSGFSFTAATAPALSEEKIKNYSPALGRVKKFLLENAKIVVETGPLS